jgi:hypothetical protein
MNLLFIHCSRIFAAIVIDNRLIRHLKKEEEEAGG